MIVLFAHHLEPHHVVIAALLFVAGALAGWAGCARWAGASSEGRSS